MSARLQRPSSGVRGFGGSGVRGFGGSDGSQAPLDVALRLSVGLRPRSHAASWGSPSDEVVVAVAADPLLVARHAYILVTASPQRLRASPVVLHGLSVPLVAKPFDVDALLAVVAEAAATLAQD